MADPAIAAPWYITGAGLIVGILWRALEGSRSQQLAAVTAERDHERTERAREREEAKATIAALGKRLDAVTAQLERERLQAAGVALRIRQDSSADDSFADDMPTAVRDREALISPKSQSMPPEPPIPRPPRAPHGAGGAQDYVDRRTRNAQEGVDTPVEVPRKR